jgi:hypothetical protein
MSFQGDLSPLLTVEHVSLTAFYGKSLQGLGQNKIVKIGHCESLTNVSALMSVPRVTINNCENICNWGDLNHVSHLTIKNIYYSNPDFTSLGHAIPISLNEKCYINKLE